MDTTQIATHIVASAVKELHRAIQDLVENKSDLQQAETALFQGLMGVGRRVLQDWLTAQAQRSPPVVCPACGQALPCHRRRKRQWLTTFGAVAFERATYDCRACRKSLNPGEATPPPLGFPCPRTAVSGEGGGDGTCRRGLACRRYRLVGEGKVGVTFEGEAVGDGAGERQTDGVENKPVIARSEGAETFVGRYRQAVVKVGGQRAPELVCVSDAAGWIQEPLKSYFPPSGIGGRWIIRGIGGKGCPWGAGCWRAPVKRR